MCDYRHCAVEEMSLLADPSTAVKVILVLEKIIICYAEIHAIVLGYICQLLVRDRLGGPRSVMATLRPFTASLRIADEAFSSCCKTRTQNDWIATLLLIVRDNRA